jgi:thymidylate synthase ThyX
MALNVTEMKHQAREFARQMKQQIRAWHQSVRKWLEAKMSQSRKHAK